jgi:hypothetical protein
MSIQLKNEVFKIGRLKYSIYPRQSGISPFFWIGVHEWQHLETSKLIWNTFPVVISKFFGKNEMLL